MPFDFISSQHSASLPNFPAVASTLSLDLLPNRLVTPLEHALLKRDGSKERRFFVIKTPLAIALSVIITAFSFGLPATAQAQSTSEIDKIRAKVQTLSTSKDSQVEVKFRDRTKLKGYIDSVEPVTFKLRNPKDGTTQSIAYSEVESISTAGSGVSTKTWLIIGGVAAGAVTTWLIVKPAVCDGGAQTRGIC